MNFFRHPLFKFKQDVSEIGSLTVHRRKGMEADTPLGLNKKKILSALASDIKSSFSITHNGIGTSMLCLLRRRKIPISGG